MMCVIKNCIVCFTFWSLLMVTTVTTEDLRYFLFLKDKQNRKWILIKYRKLPLTYALENKRLISFITVSQLLPEIKLNVLPWMLQNTNNTKTWLVLSYTDKPFQWITMNTIVRECHPSMFSLTLPLRLQMTRKNFGVWYLSNIFFKRKSTK